MIIDNILLDKLTAQAKDSPRLRMNQDMRTTSEDGSQRMLNALEPGTMLPIHRHKETTEVVVILRGAATQYFYDENGNVDEVVTIKAGSECTGMSVERGRWHRIESLESGTVIFEAKDGAYEPMAEDDAFLNVLRHRIAELKENEARGCSMEPRMFTPEYVHRMWGGKVPMDLIAEAMRAD